MTPSSGHCREEPVEPLDPRTLEPVIAASARERLTASIAAGPQLPRVWNVNSTAAGGGVAEMLRSMIGYARGAGADIHWMVVSGAPDFYRVTKRLHNFLHGHAGDGGRLGAADRAVYEETSAGAAADLLRRVTAGDVAILHDPQTAGLAPPLRDRGVRVVWRSHIGVVEANPLTYEAWQFLLPYLTAADGFIFSRHAYVPPALEGRRVEIVHPSIDPLSTKNHALAPETVTRILEHTGLVTDGPARAEVPSFVRHDGRRDEIRHACEVLRTGPPPSITDRIVTQVSRWDRLKDPIGVMRGFCAHVLPKVEAHLILAGPNVSGVADDPEGAEVLNESEAFWRTLPHAERRRVQLACLPMHDVEENGAIVNALQRGSDVVVQKSLEEGFGLTVTEAMWKGRAVVASDVGGIPEQLEDGRTGMLLADPGDLAAFGSAVAGLLEDHERRDALGTAAREAVREQFLHDRHLAQLASVVRELRPAPGP